MRRISSLYLAGPELWFPQAGPHREAQRLIVEAAGYSMLAADLPTPSAEPSELTARILYAERLTRLRTADAGIVNLTPWRGPSCDPATAFEAGFLAALGKPVFAFLNISGEHEAEYGARVEDQIGLAADGDGMLRDLDGCLVEDLGLPESFMLWAEARRLFVIVALDPLGELAGLEMCLEAVKAYDAD
ncbi:MAG: nucleoside 2-deoxyribosyltransferase [Caulobacter sp.]|nr:nucleoside 2-deoxyribosyltransferase [Caulobacter sp.]